MYKYLGANINEHLDFISSCLANSAGRALSSNITEMIKTVLYDKCVTIISDYASEITGWRKLK